MLNDQIILLLSYINKNIHFLRKYEYVGLLHLKYYYLETKHLSRI